MLYTSPRPNCKTFCEESAIGGCLCQVAESCTPARLCSMKMGRVGPR